MELFELKFDSRFVVSYLEKLIPTCASKLERISEMIEEFKNTLIKTDTWDQRRLYLLLMFIYYFEPIKTHINDHPDQHSKWKTFVAIHLNNVVEKHIDFKYNAKELVVESLNLFFII